MKNQINRSWSFPVHAASAAVLLAALAGTSPALGVIITVNFSNTWNALPAAKRAQAQAVVNQAAANWSNAITDNFNLTVNVDWAVPLAFGNDNDGVCGVGGVLATQQVGGVTKPSLSRIILNSNLLGAGGAGTWFIDPTPATSEEYAPIPGRPWRGNATDPAAVDHIDMLSCAKHEFGHALGFLFDQPNGLFVPYIAQVVANNGISTPEFGGMILPVPPVGGLNIQSHFSALGNVPGTMIPMSDLLMTPNAPINGDERRSFSPYDVAGVAAVLGLPLNVGYNLDPKGVIPAPGATAFAAAGLTLALRRRRAAQ